MRPQSSIPPSLCGSFLRNKRSLLAFTWTITTVLTLVAFVMALVMTVHVHMYYKRVERYYEDKLYEYQQNYKQQSGDGDKEHNKQQEADDSYKEFQAYIKLSQVSSGSMTFCALYTMFMAMALALYGSTAIVGFTSLQGVYIAPCFSSPSSSKLKVGMFGGAIVFFANLLLLCAVIFGEVRVEDYQERQNQEDREPYEVERIATVLAVTCMFLSALYTIFAILLFLYYGSEDRSIELETDGVVSSKPLSSIRNVHHDPRRENFITMGESS